MGASTIEWTDATWNPVTGCTEVSPGCANCYAKRFAERFRDVPGHPFEHGFDLQLRPERLNEPLHWRKPRRVFVCSMADLFHEQVPTSFIENVWNRMAWAERHTFQILTKRTERLDAWANDRQNRGAVPLPNVWIGTSIENDHFAYRAALLRWTPAAVRFVSAEPLLGPLPSLDLTGIDWLIVGGESGPGARPMHPDWVRDIRDQCRDAGVPFFFKQWGEYLPVAVEDDPGMFTGRAFTHPIRGGRTSASIRVGRESRAMRPGDRNGFGTMLDPDTIALRIGKHAAGRTLDGRTWSEYPKETR